MFYSRKLCCSTQESCSWVFPEGVRQHYAGPPSQDSAVCDTTTLQGTEAGGFNPPSLLRVSTDQTKVVRTFISIGECLLNKPLIKYKKYIPVLFYIIDACLFV